MESKLCDAQSFDYGGDYQCGRKDEQDDSASTSATGFLFILHGHDVSPPFLSQIYASIAGCKGWPLLPLEILEDTIRDTAWNITHILFPTAFASCLPRCLKIDRRPLSS